LLVRSAPAKAEMDDPPNETINIKNKVYLIPLLFLKTLLKNKVVFFHLLKESEQVLKEKLVIKEKNLLINLVLVVKKHTKIAKK